MSLWAATAESAAVPATMATILEVNPPAGRRVVVSEASITFSGVSSTDVPVLVQTCRVTAASAAGTAVTPADQQDSGGTVLAAAKKLPASEGTVVILKTYMVPPSSGLVIQYPLGREPRVEGAAAAAKGYSVRANRGAGAAINSDANIEWEE